MTLTNIIPYLIDRVRYRNSLAYSSYAGERGEIFTDLFGIRYLCIGGGWMRMVGL